MKTIRRIPVVVLALLTFFLLAGTALAQQAATGTPATPSPAMARVIDMAIYILGGAIGVVLTWLAHRLVALLEKKIGLKLGAEKEAKLDKLIKDAIAFGEEQAHKAVKKNETALKMSDKMEAAAGFAVDLADKYGVDEIAREKATKLIEAKLNKGRALPA
jgi:hypothetical protein